MPQPSSRTSLSRWDEGLEIKQIFRVEEGCTLEPTGALRSNVVALASDAAFAW